MNTYLIRLANWGILGAGVVINLVLLFSAFRVGAIVFSLPYFVAAGLVATARQLVLALITMPVCLVLVVSGTRYYQYIVTIESETRGIGITFMIGFQLLGCVALLILLSIGRELINCDNEEK